MEGHTFSPQIPLPSTGHTLCVFNYTLFQEKGIPVIITVLKIAFKSLGSRYLLNPSHNWQPLPPNQPSLWATLGYVRYMGLCEKYVTGPRDGETSKLTIMFTPATQSHLQSH